MNIKDVISNDLDVTLSLLDDALTFSRIHVKRFTIPKNNGGYRVIYQPSKKLKTIQHWLIHNIFNDLDIHYAATAYQRNTSTLLNAERHKNNKFFLRIDLKDFFPSIKYTDLIPIIKKWHISKKPSWVLNIEAEDIINKSCFYRGNTLPIGYPSSPIISNIVMYDFDIRIVNILKNKDDFKDVEYTRYADDLIFSTKRKGVCKEVFTAVRDLIEKTKSPNISINPSKTRFTSSLGGTAIVTGLRICSDNHITIHKKQKDHIRLLLSLYKKDSLNNDEFPSLLGHISYISHVDPTFYTKLQKKYFKEITELNKTRDFEY